MVIPYSLPHVHIIDVPSDPHTLREKATLSLGPAELIVPALRAQAADLRSLAQAGPSLYGLGPFGGLSGSVPLRDQRREAKHLGPTLSRSSRPSHDWQCSSGLPANGDRSSWRQPASPDGSDARVKCRT